MTNAEITKITSQNSGSMFDGITKTVAMPMARPKSESKKIIFQFMSLPPWGCRAVNAGRCAADISDREEGKSTMAPGFRCGRSAIGDLQQIAKRVLMHFRKPYENPFVFAVVIGDVVGFRIGGHQLVAAVERHFEDDRIEILAKPD